MQGEGETTLEVAFEFKELRTICEDDSQAKIALGSLVAETLKRRLADMRAATSINDLIVGRPRLDNDSDERQMFVDLRSGYCMKFCANHPRNPLTESGKIDWSKISRIKILAIEVFND